MLRDNNILRKTAAKAKIAPMSRIPYVIDNDRHKLADVLNQVLETHRDLAMDVATAFFNIRGYGFLREKLRDLGSLRLLLGAEPRSGEDLGLKPRLAALQAALRGDLATEPYRPETLLVVEDLIRFLRQDHVHVRLFDHGFLHAKCYLFYGDPKGAPLFDRFRPVLGIVGSSNFTGPGLATNRELNLVHKGIISPEEVDDRAGAASGAQPLLGAGGRRWRRSLRGRNKTARQPSDLLRIQTRAEGGSRGRGHLGPGGLVRGTVGRNPATSSRN